jgi:MFS family permease
LSGWVQPVHIILLGAVLGVVNAFDMPARQALVHKLVSVDDLPNAVALNSSMINAARIIGPGIAGLVVATVGEGGLLLDKCDQLSCRDHRSAGHEICSAKDRLDKAGFSGPLTS